MRIFLFLLVATSGSLVQVQGDNEDGSKPYLDADGNLCQDKMETVQDTEYETMIQCRVAMKKSCSQQRMTEDDNEVGGHDNHEESSPDNACHTVYEKNCQTVYRPHRNKVRQSQLLLSFDEVIFFLSFGNATRICVMCI